MEEIDGPARLARAVRDRRLELGISTAAALARLLGLSQRLVGEIENGRRDSYSESTLRSLDSALGWWVGASESLLNGTSTEPRIDSRRQIPSPSEINRVLNARQEGPPPVTTKLIDALDIGDDRLVGLSDADLAEIEMVARLAASERARALQAEKREAIGERAVEAVHRSVDTRSTTTSPTRTTT